MSSEVMASLGKLQEAVDATLHKLEEQDFAARAWKKDAALWKADPATQHQIANAMGWLDVIRTMHGHVADLTDLANTVKAEGYKYVVLLGMGGSSLGPEVLRLTFGQIAGAPKLLVVDTTDPGFILKTEAAIDPAHTIFIVSSKSGTTTEPNTFMAYYFDKVKGTKGDKAGENFIAITDAGTSLEKHARDHNFREVFLNPADIGGRYSVLSYFGLVPAVLAGYDIGQLLSRAISMADECHKPGLDNPGLHLGAIMGTAAVNGRDKTTIIVPAAISSYGLWAEQLIAESTGKEGRGIIPVAGEPLGDPSVYGNDRLFVSLSVAGQKDADNEAKLKRLEEAGHPVVRLSLNDLLDIGAEFFRWEFAIPVAGSVVGINPFDQPNVTESKDNTKRLLGDFVKNGQLPQLNLVQGDSFKVAFGQGQPSDAATGLREFMAGIKPGDYVAFMAYSLENAADDAALQAIRTLVRDHFKVATTVGYGPRFLHSTGQLHKGGNGSGVFVQIVSPDPQDAPIPDEPYGFSILKQAQALGDFESLQQHGRRVISIQPQGDLSSLTAAIQASL